MTKLRGRAIGAMAALALMAGVPGAPLAAAEIAPQFLDGGDFYHPDYGAFIPVENNGRVPQGNYDSCLTDVNALLTVHQDYYALRTKQPTPGVTVRALAVHQLYTATNVHEAKNLIRALYSEKRLAACVKQTKKRTLVDPKTGKKVVVSKRFGRSDIEDTSRPQYRTIRKAAYAVGLYERLGETSLSQNADGIPRNTPAAEVLVFFRKGNVVTMLYMKAPGKLTYEMWRSLVYTAKAAYPLVPDPQ